MVRAHHAQRGRERLLAQYNSSDSDWLESLRGVLDDCLSWNPTDRPLFCHTAIGHTFEPDHGMYGGPGIFGTGFDLSEPVFNLGGVMLGRDGDVPDGPDCLLVAAIPAGSRRLDEVRQRVRLHKVCDWQIAKNCESRRRFVLAFPMSNYIIYFMTCSPCARELANRI